MNEEIHPERQQQARTHLRKQRKQGQDRLNRLLGWIPGQQCTYHDNRGWVLGVSFQKPYLIHAANEPSNPERLLIRRMRACVGWAIHGIIIDLVSGDRIGYCHRLASLSDENGIKRRHGTPWVDVEFGDHVVGLSGFNLQGAGAYLCHSLNFHLASGRTISFAATHEPWKGFPFQWHVPEHTLFHYPSFRGGCCNGLSAVQTTMHLPVQVSFRYHNTLTEEQMERRRLSEPAMKKLRDLSVIIHCINLKLQVHGCHGLGPDVWRAIIGDYMLGRDLLDAETPFRALSRERRSQSRKEVAPFITI